MSNKVGRPRIANKKKFQRIAIYKETYAVLKKYSVKKEQPITKVLDDLIKLLP